MLFWIILLTIIFYRMLFHNPINEKLLPTLFILIAPPAVGFVSYTRLVGEADNFGRILYAIGLFLTLQLLTQAPRFIRLKFFLSWWAYSFPLAAISIASFLQYELTNKAPYLWIASALLGLLTVLVAILIAKTVNAIRHKRICVED
jgi:tellurite resistance protein